MKFKEQYVHEVVETPTNNGIKSFLNKFLNKNNPPKVVSYVLRKTPK
jgi:hypothetical protein